MLQMDEILRIHQGIPGMQIAGGLGETVVILLDGTAIFSGGYMQDREGFPMYNPYKPKRK